MAYTLSQFLTQVEQGNPILITAITPNADVVLSIGETSVILSDKYQTRVSRGGANIPAVVTQESDLRALDLGTLFTAEQVLGSLSLRQAIDTGAVKAEAGTEQLTLVGTIVV